MRCRTRRPETHAAVLAVLISTLLTAVPAMAQTTRPAGEPQRTGDAETAPALLAGPTVTEKAEDNNTSMVPGPSGNRDSARGQLQPRQWFRLLRDIEMNEELRTSIATIARQLQRDMDHFNREHREELAALRSSVQAMRNGGRPDPEVRERFAAIQQQRPKVEAYQQRVWELLDEGQQEALRTSIERVHAEQAKRRRQRQANEASKAGDTPDAMTNDGTMSDDSMSESDDDMSDDDMSGADKSGDDMTSDRRRRAQRDDEQMDRAARRRLRFLRQRQSRPSSDPE